MATDTDQAFTEQDDGADSKRERSTIDFPYMDLGMAISVANGVHARVGGGACQHDELAVQLGLSPSSSAYRTRISTARMFGLIASERGSDAVRLTDLGSRIVDSTQARDARARVTWPLSRKRSRVEHHPGRCGQYVGIG